jgi:4'-phosphopantetheinyl transferase
MPVLLYYTIIEERLPEERYKKLLKNLPETISNRIMKFRRWQDAHTGLFGKHLLMRALADLGCNYSLDELKYNEYNRPYLDCNIDFNIAHSGKVVACAAATDTRIGIDVEEIQPIEISDFRSQFTDTEWELINNGKSPLLKFYHYWTIKEAVVKADGGGISQIPGMLILNEEQVALNRVIWNIKSIALIENYSCFLAIDNACQDIIIKKINFDDESL